MPIKPKYKKFYGKEWREVTRPRILSRAHHQCEKCLVPNHKLVSRSHDSSWRLQGERHWLLGDGNFAPKEWKPSRIRTTYVVLTIAHLDHIPGHDTDDNLKALCQACHLSLDARQHYETRATRKDAARPLLQATL